MKKEYYIPTIEVVCLEMQIPIALATSKESAPTAPERRDPAF